MVTQESLLQNIQTIIDFLIIIGIAIAVLSAIAALVISFFASERTKETWYGRCKIAFVIGVAIVLIPGLFKLVLSWFGAEDKFKLPTASAVPFHVQAQSLASSILEFK